MWFVIKLKVKQFFRIIWIFIREKIKKIVRSKPFIGALMLTLGISWTWVITFSYFEGDNIALFARESVAEFIKPKSFVAVNPPIAKAAEKVEEVKKEEWLMGEFTAYTPRVQETDADPYTNAANKRVKTGDIACPQKYSFGTKIEIKGRGVYECWDRMNQRYEDKENFDIFMWDLAEAQAFGRQKNVEYRVVGQ